MRLRMSRVQFRSVYMSLSNSILSLEFNTQTSFLWSSHKLFSEMHQEKQLMLLILFNIIFRQLFNIFGGSYTDFGQSSTL